jgi:hypothetical protein
MTEQESPCLKPQFYQKRKERMKERKERMKERKEDSKNFKK